MECRPDCGACCVAPSITSPLPGLPRGKPAGMRCPHLSSHLRCLLYGDPRRPAVCASLKPSAEMCGATAGEAYAYFVRLEALTAP